MLKVIIILIIAIVIASILFTLIKKTLKLVLFVGLVVIVFILITNILSNSESSIIEKGKNYILGKSESLIDTGKDKVTSYVILETNETVNKAKEKFLDSISD